MRWLVHVVVNICRPTQYEDSKLNQSKDQRSQNFEMGILFIRRPSVSRAILLYSNLALLSSSIQNYKRSSQVLNVSYVTLTTTFWGKFVRRWLKVVMLNTRITNNVSIFNCSEDIVGFQKFKIGHVTQATNIYVYTFHL